MIRNDRVGDLLLTLPAIEAVRRALPQARISLLVNARNVPLVRDNPHLDEVLEDHLQEHPRSVGARLRSRRFDAAVVVNTNTRNCLATWWARIPRRICWAYKPAGLLLGNRWVTLHRSRPPVHEAEFALEFVRRLGIRADLCDHAPRLAIPLSIESLVSRRIEQRLGTEGPLFGINPGSKASAYNWPLESYVRLVTWLSKYGRVMVTGSPEEAPLLRFMEQRLGAESRRRIAFFDDFDLIELAAAISRQDVLTVSNTGPMHLAGAVGTPAVALFSAHPAQAPQKWSPLGRGHCILVAPMLPSDKLHMAENEIERHMSRLTVEQVLSANLRLARERIVAPPLQTADSPWSRSSSR